MKEIKLLAQAEVEGYDGAVLNLHHGNTRVSYGQITGSYYTAIGADADGAEHQIIWEIADKEAFEAGDGDCCEWEHPAQVLNLETGEPVNDDVNLIF